MKYFSKKLWEYKGSRGLFWKMNVFFYIFFSFFIITGEAERGFGNLKKRYSKKKTHVTAVKRSGAGREDVAKAEKELGRYSFLSYLDNQASSSRLTISSHLPAASQPVASAEYEAFDDNVSSNSEEEVEEEEKEVKSPIPIPNKKPTSIPTQKPNVPKWGKRKMEDVVLESINKRLKEKKSTGAKEEEDNEAHFGKMVAAEMRTIPEPYKNNLKYTINMAIFQHHQMVMKAAATTTTQENEQQQSIQIHEIEIYNN